MPDQTPQTALNSERELMMRDPSLKRKLEERAKREAMTPEQWANHVRTKMNPRWDAIAHLESLPDDESDL